MDGLFRAGIGLFVIGVGYSLPYIDFLGLTFSNLPQLNLVVLQVALVIAGLALVIKEDE